MEIVNKIQHRRMTGYPVITDLSAQKPSFKHDRRDPNFDKTFQQMEDERMERLRGHKNITFTFFTFKRC